MSERADEPLAPPAQVIARDRGSATIWMLGCVLLVLAVLTATLVRTLAVLARHRAESAADLAALAAAGRIGTSSAPCPAAAGLADRNGARVISCDVHLDADGRSGTVLVRVTASAALPVVGIREVTASARAGRLPAEPSPDAIRIRAGPPGGPAAAPVAVAAPGGPTGGVWHAFPRTEPVCEIRAGRVRGW